MTTMVAEVYEAFISAGIKMKKKQKLPLLL